MTVCFNTLNVTGPNSTTDRLLAKAFEDCELDDWGISPQNFSFRPFLEAEQHANPPQYTGDAIWTNWIDRQKEDERREKLLIEFETESEPPIHAINALIKWLDREQLSYQLNMTYRLENDRFKGEVKAEGPH